jgi:hypothetical protein
MRVGRPPQDGASRLTIRTYRVGSDGEPEDAARQHTVMALHDAERLRQSMQWPPCRCPRCRTGHGPAPS